MQSPRGYRHRRFQSSMPFFAVKASPALIHAAFQMRYGVLSDDRRVREPGRRVGHFRARRLLNWRKLWLGSTRRGKFGLRRLRDGSSGRGRQARAHRARWPLCGSWVIGSENRSCEPRFIITNRIVKVRTQRTNATYTELPQARQHDYEREKHQRNPVGNLIGVLDRNA